MVTPADPKTENAPMGTEYRVYDYPGGIAGEDFSPAGALTGYTGGQYLIVAVTDVEDTFVHYQNNYPITDNPPVGVAQNNPTNGGQLAVRLLGRSKVVAGVGGLAIGDLVGSDAAGRAVKKRPSQTGANLGDWVLGWCSHAAAVGEVAGIELSGMAFQV